MRALGLPQMKNNRIARLKSVRVFRRNDSVIRAGSMRFMRRWTEQTPQEFNPVGLAALFGFTLPTPPCAFPTKRGSRGLLGKGWA